MGDLTRNFSRSEFTCRCGCGYDDISPALVALLQDIRDYFDAPVTVTSGCRCREHNEASGGATRSQHLYGTAADIKVYDVSPRAVYDFIDLVYPTTGGLHAYESFTHVDVRGHRSRW